LIIVFIFKKVIIKKVAHLSSFQVHGGLMATKKNRKEKVREKKKDEEAVGENVWGTETTEDYYDFERNWRLFDFEKGRLKVVIRF
jgi:hypothetical protein